MVCVDVEGITVEGRVGWKEEEQAEREARSVR